MEDNAALRGRFQEVVSSEPPDQHDAERLEALQARHRIGAAIKRLEAEVAEHQADDELVCSACGRPYALHGIGCPALSRDESPLDSLERTLAIAEEVGIGPSEHELDGGYRGMAADFEQEAARVLSEGLGSDRLQTRTRILKEWQTCRETEPDEKDWCEQCRKPTDPGPRFGDRLRGFLRELPDQGPGQAEGALITLEGRQIAALADAVDQDAAHLRAGLKGWPVGVPTNLRAWAAELRQFTVHDLRTKVEALVEELRYLILGCDERTERDVVDAEPLLDRLAGIFGARQEARPNAPRLMMHLGVVDLKGVPESRMWGDGEYSRVLDQANAAGWGWLNSRGSDPRLVGVGMLKAVAPRQPEHGMTVGGLGDEP